MGFDGERASYEPLKKLIMNEQNADFLKRIKVREDSPQFFESISQKLIRQESLESNSNQQPDLIIAIDGGREEVPILTGFPSASYGYVTVSSVLMDLKKISELEKEPFPNPIEVRNTETSVGIYTTFPGCNVFENDNEEPKAFLRRRLFEELQNHNSFENGESVLQTYEYLLDKRLQNNEREQKCPISGYENCKIELQKGKFICPHSSQTLYSTDALRIYENMKQDGSNLGIFTQIMSMLEKLWLVNILRSFEQRNWLSTLRRVAFIVDGPLAVFDTAAWLSQYIGEEVGRLNKKQKEINGQDLIIVGLEKSGNFVEHFERLDINQSGDSERFSNGSAFLLDNDYIKQNIQFSTSTEPYGKATYFGRKFFYKTASGQRLVPVVASYSANERDILTAEISQFSRLKDIMQLLDKLISSRYPNSITPLISAHAQAAIPQMGQKLFEDLAREIRERDINNV